MRFRPSPSAWLIRSALRARLVLCRAGSLWLGVCNRSTVLLVVNVVWLVDAVAVSSARPTLAQRRSLWFYWVEKYGRDI